MTGINYLDKQLSPVAMRCSFKGCPCRVGCWHLKRAHRVSCNPKFPEDVRRAYAGGPPVLIQKRLEAPLHWKKAQRIGVQFMGDWMDDQVQPQWIDRMIGVMFKAQQHQYFTLTKNPARLVREMPWINNSWGGLPTCVYNGVSITDQEDADRMIPELLRIPGKHWISIEPFLKGPIDLGFTKVVPTPCEAWPNSATEFATFISSEIQWVIIGCESGPNRRPMPLEWAVDVVQQCQAAGVPVWVKQIDLNGKVCHDINLFPEALKVRQLP
ncbi:MAG: DUF5131 family protein [Pseudomonadota bacterium]